MIVMTGEILVDMIRQSDSVASPRIYAGVLGGSVLNSATVLAKAGVPTRFVGELGNDKLGDWGMAQIRTRGIEADHIVQREAPTMLAMVELDEAGKASYGFYPTLGGFAFEPQPEALDGAHWFHFGSISAFEERIKFGITSLLERAQQKGIVVSFDPNLRQAPDRAFLRQLRAYMPFVSLLKASIDDAELLFPDTPKTPQALLEKLASYGAPLTVMTLGEDGAIAHLHGRFIKVPGVKVAVVDTIGAGDTFTAGLLYGLSKRDIHSAKAVEEWNGEGLEGILTKATGLAAAACTVQGAGLPEGAIERLMQ
jgi:fructokinase